MNANIASTFDLLPTDEPQGRIRQLHEFMQNKLVIGTCLLLSVVLHGVFIVRWQGFDSNHHPHMITGHNIEIVLSQQSITPTLPTEKKETTKPQEKAEPVAPVQHKVINQKKENSIVKAVATEPENIEPVIEQPVNNDPVVEEQEPINQVQPLQVAIDNALLMDEKKQYLQLIAAHLDKHKYYPRSARRRHIEGEVKVSFDLMSNGDIANLQLHSGHSSLQRATKESINSALPMPLKPESLKEIGTLNIEYTMQFSLQN